MSGGSYNYLCHASAGDLSGREDDLRAMVARLEEMRAPVAAAWTRRILQRLDDLQREVEELYGVWHAVEWADSGDYSEEQARQIVLDWQARHARSSGQVAAIELTADIVERLRTVERLLIESTTPLEGEGDLWVDRVYGEQDDDEDDTCASE